MDGAHEPNWKNRLRALFIRKALGIEPELLLGGGNYLWWPTKTVNPRRVLMPLSVDGLLFSISNAYLSGWEMIPAAAPASPES